MRLVAKVKRRKVVYNLSDDEAINKIVELVQPAGDELFEFNYKNGYLTIVYYTSEKE